jgi:hypothetical protein
MVMLLYVYRSVCHCLVLDNETFSAIPLVMCQSANSIVESVHALFMLLYCLIECKIEA